MKRRDALKIMGAGVASVFMLNIAPKTHAAILKDREKSKNRLVFYFTATGNSLFIAKQFSDAPLSIPQELKKGNNIRQRICKCSRMVEQLCQRPRPEQ